MRVVGLLLLIVIISSCSAGKSGDVTETGNPFSKVAELESELNTFSGSREELVELKNQLNTALVDIYHNGSNEDAATALYKLHMSFASDKKYVLSAKYGDTLINNYPDFNNREMVIESQYNNYDMFISPRDKDKVKHYLELWLQEFPDMDSTKRADIEFRLEFVGLTIEQLMERNQEELK